VNVYPGPTFYREVSKAVLSRIAREHLLNDQPVEEFVVEDEQTAIDFSKLNLNF
jgi:(2Fe-2S) ferredoxin